MSYSSDLRQKVIEFIEQGNNKRDAAKVFGIGERTIYSWIKQLRDHGNLNKKSYFKNNPKIDEISLRRAVEESPDYFLREFALKFNVTSVGIWKALKRMRITLKKKTTKYKERNEEDRRQYLDIISTIDTSKIVYVDESGINEFMHRTHGRAKKGTKVYGEISGKRFVRENMVSGRCLKELVAPMCFKGWKSF